MISEECGYKGYQDGTYWYCKSKGEEQSIKDSLSKQHTEDDLDGKEDSNGN